MERTINISIYLIYIIIASISVIISYKVSLIMSLVVVAIEYIRLIAIYKKVYGVIGLIFIMNVGLIGYNGYQNEKTIKSNNKQIIQTNKTISEYIATKDLKATTLIKLKNDIKSIEEAEIEWWVLVVIYAILEASLIIVLLKIANKASPNEQSNITKVETTKSKVMNEKIRREIKVETKKEQQEVININNENLEYVGSYVEYARNNDLSIRKAGALFKQWKKAGRLIKKDGKNYLKV